MLVKSVNFANNSLSSINQNRGSFQSFNFTSSSEKRSQTDPNKKNHKLLWASLITASLGAGAFAFFPAARMVVSSLFKKRVSQDVIDASINKFAQETRNLKFEKGIYINPRTGESVYRLTGEKNKIVSKGLKNLKELYLNETCLFGHNHPEQIIPTIDGKYYAHYKDVPFSYADFYAAIITKANHYFVVTQEKIHHMKFNNNHDKNKFLDYLEKTNRIKSEDRAPNKIQKVILGIPFEQNIPEHEWYSLTTREKIDDFYKNRMSKIVAEDLSKDMKNLADTMGWTYWREPLPKE